MQKQTSKHILIVTDAWFPQDNGVVRTLSNVKSELEQLGLSVTETQDSLSITGAPSIAGGVTADGHGDHRMIMLLTLLGLRAQSPITITGAHHIRKSYPTFFRHLEALGARFEYVPTEGH